MTSSSSIFMIREYIIQQAQNLFGKNETIEDMRVKYIHSDAILFLKKIINFVQPIPPYWMSSLLVAQWKNDGK